MPNPGTLRTLDDLAKAILAATHEHMRTCQCRKCFREGFACCLDCSECRAVLEDAVLDVLRAVNRRT